MPFRNKEKYSNFTLTKPCVKVSNAALEGLSCQSQLMGSGLDFVRLPLTNVYIIHSQLQPEKITATFGQVHCVSRPGSTIWAHWAFLIQNEINDVHHPLKQMV